MRRLRYAGLITFNDIVESVIGEVKRPVQDTGPLIVQRDTDSWLLDGSLPVDKLRDLMKTESLPSGEAAGGDYHTLGGLVMMHMGHIPRTVEAFEWEGFRFEVVDMDGQRINKVMLTRLPSENAGAESEGGGG